MLTLFAFQRLAPRLPGPLITVVLAAAIVALFSLGDHGIDVVGPVPVGLPTPSVPGLGIDSLPVLIIPAVGAAFVGYADNVVTARAVVLKQRHQSIDANQEWLALGLSNVSSSLLHGFPVISSGSRTAIAAAVGARTPLSSLVAMGVVLVTLLAAGPLLAVFPRPALGALVVYAAVKLIDGPELRRIAAFRKSELFIAILTTVAVIGLGVIVGIVVAIGLSVVDLLRRVGRPHGGILGYVPGVAGMHDVDDYPSARASGRGVSGSIVGSLASAPGRPEFFRLNVAKASDLRTAGPPGRIRRIGQHGGKVADTTSGRHG